MANKKLQKIQFPQYNFNTKLYQGGGEKNDYIDIEADDAEIGRLIAQGYIVEELPQAQEGLDTGVVESKTPWEGASKVTGEETTPPVIYEGKDVTVKAKGPEWARFQREYQNANPWERYLAGEKNKYLRKNKGLNKAAGVTADNFPKDAEERIRQEYDRKMNTYTTRRLGKYFDYNPRQRGEWIDLLTPKEREIVAGSKYGSKLQPNAWSRFMSGARSIYNAGPLSNVTGDITTPIPGYTERENKEALNNWAEGMEILAPLDVPGMIVANKMKNMNAENPSWYSGEMMGNVNYGDVIASNPLTLLDIYGLPEMLVTAGKAGLKYGVKPFVNEMANTYQDVRNVMNYSNDVNDVNDLNRIFTDYSANLNPTTAANTIGREASALENSTQIPRRVNQLGYTPETTSIIPEGMVTGEQIAPQLQTQKAKPVQTWSPTPVTENTATLSSMQETSPLFKIVDKRTGNMNINNIKAYLNKADTPKSDKVMLQEIIDEKFPNQKNINWDDLKKAVNEEVGQFRRTESDTYATYGIDKLKLGPDVVNTPELQRTYIDKLKFQLSDAKNMIKDADGLAEDAEFVLASLGNSNTIPTSMQSLVFQNFDGTYHLAGFPQRGWQYAHDAFSPSNHDSLDDVKKTLERYINEAKNEASTFNSQKISLEQQIQNPPPLTGNAKTILYSNPEKIGSGSRKHFNDPDALGHSRIMERADEPENMYFLETQSDWQQNPDINYGFEWDKDYETRLKGFEADIKGIEDKIAQYKEALNDQDNLFGQEIIKDRITMHEHDLSLLKQKLRNYKKDASPGTQKQFLREKTQERLIQEEFITAAAAGKDYVLFPTRETAAKIQGYDWNKGPAKGFIRRYERDLPDDAQHIIDNYLPNLESDVLTNIDNIKAFENLPEVKQYKLNSDKSMYFELHDKARDLITKRNRVNKFKNELNNATDKAAFENQVIYNPDHETVLKKYDDKPKLYKKLTGQEPVPYTDPDGNTWMKVKIPEKIKKGQGEIRAFKQGGYVDKLSKFIR